MIDGPRTSQPGLMPHTSGGDAQKVEEDSLMQMPSPKKRRISADQPELSECCTTPHDNFVAMAVSPAAETETLASHGPTYDTFFINSDDELDTLSQNILSQNVSDTSTGSPVISVIQTPEDLQRDSLTQSVIITDDGDFESRDGLIFGDTPVTLLIDFRHFPTERLPELNELFEQPARLEGRLLKGNVRIVAMISRDMIPAREGQENVPGPDFWWRINSTCPPKSIDQVAETEAAVLSPRKWVDQAIPDVSKAESMDTGAPPVTLDFTGRDWRSLLFGTPSVSEDGGLIYQPGALEQLQPGSHLIFKNAPWDNQAFVVQLAHAFGAGQFRSNDSVVILPNNLTMHRCPLSEEEIKSAADSLNWQPMSVVHNTGQGRVACINADTVDMLLQEVILTEQGGICRHDTLAGWLEGASGIRITSPLSQSQWLQLVRRLGEAKSLHLPIATDVPEEQPQLFRSATPALMDSQRPAQRPAKGVNINIEVHQADAQLPLSATGTGQEAVEEFVILPEQSLSKVAQSTRIASLRKRQFECQVTQLIQALRAGKAVCLSGLQHNPILLRQLESLLCQPPHLLIFGKREEFPTLNLRITWPADQEIPSPVWRAYLQAAQPPVPVEQVGPRVKTDVMQAFEKLYHAMENLTSASCCPASPPADIHGLFNKVMVQAGCEQAMDDSDDLLPYHIYKAINSVVLKEYRGNLEVYDYLKNLSCRLFLDHTDNEPWIDREYLQHWLNQHHWFSKDDIEKAFWSLAKAFPATLFQPCQIPGENDVNHMMAVLVVLASGDDEAALRQQLDYTTLDKQSLSLARQTLAKCKQRSLQQEKQFFNQLISLSSSQRQSGCIHQQVRILADAARDGETALQAAIQQVLTPEAWQDGTLVAALCSGQFNWEAWEQRRINRLADKVRKHPVVFIKGETGAGKSYIAEVVARTLNPELPPHVITVGPETELSDLLGRIALKPGDGQSQDEDFQTQAVLAPFRLWAEQKSRKPVVLVIDEANLAIPELWNCLKGLFENPPCLYAHGERIPVSPQHRIIMTGNPDHFSGRRMNELLRIRAPQLFYKPLNPAFVRNKVLHLGLTETLAALPCISPADAQKAVPYLVETIGMLYTQYQKQLPERVFTPRDLSDIISRIQTILATHTSPIALTEAGMNGLVWQALDDALGGEFPPALQPGKKALEHWYMSRKQTDNSIIYVQQNQFEDFYNDWVFEQKRIPVTSQLDCTNDSVRQLMRHIWLEQHRSQQEVTTDTPHRGRHATVIVGPAGRGKSALLDQQLTFMCNQNGTTPPRQINAGSSTWELLQQAVKEAKELGRPLIVSELNLLKSEEIEGLLNNATTGKAAPGFHFYITVNPASFVGRHRFSPALKNRFTCLSIGDYTDQDIQSIGNRIFARLEDKPRQQIIDWHLRLRQHLKSGKTPLQPSVGDLKRLARTLPANPTDEQLKQAFETQYSLFLAAGNCSLDTLPELTLTQAMSEDGENSLSMALNSKLLLTQPVVVEAESELSEIKVRATRIVVPEVLLNRNEPEIIAKTSGHSLLALALDKWKESSGSTASPCEEDTLFSTCYRLWQQHFIQQTFALPSDLLPLSPEQQATRDHPDNQVLFNRIQELIQQPPSPRGLKMLWEKLSSVVAQTPDQTTDQTTEKQQQAQEQSDTTATSEISRPEPVEMPFDNQTAAQKYLYYLDQYFEDVNPVLQRMRVSTLIIDGEHVRDITMRTGQKGVNVICPAHLKAPVFTTGKEHYGVVNRRLSTTAYITLPGLYPHQTITRLSTDPEIPLDQLDITRDRATGEFLVRLKQPWGDKDSFIADVHYVVKELQSDQTIEDAKLPAPSGSPLKALVDEALGEGASAFNTDSSKALIESLTQWGRGFQATEDIAAETGTETLSEIIKRKQGACRHRARAVWAIAASRGLPVRMISSGAHRWLECSPDQGKHWMKINLFGASSEAMAFVNQPNLKESAKGLIFPAEERLNLLAEAKRNPSAFASRIGSSVEDVFRWIEGNGLTPLKINNASSAFNYLMKSNSVERFRIALDVLLSEEMTPRVASGSLRMFIHDLSTRYAEILEGSKSEAERQTMFRLLGKIRPMLKGDSHYSANEQWVMFIKAIDARLGGRMFNSYNPKQRNFEWLSYAIVEGDLLKGLSEEEISEIHHIFKYAQREAPKPREADVQELHKIFEKQFSPYYPSIKAPAQKTKQACGWEKPADLKLVKGAVPSLEGRLRITRIGAGYTWQPEGSIDLDRLLKQQAPFREQKAIVSTRAIKVVQNKNKLMGIDRFHSTNLYRKITGSDFSIAGITHCLSLPRQIDLQVENFLYGFYASPTSESMDNILSFLNSHNIAVPEWFHTILRTYLQHHDMVEAAFKNLPTSYAQYLEKTTRANQGKFDLYYLAQNEQFRGHRKLRTWQAIVEANAIKEEFLPIPDDLVVDHLKKEDGDSLILTSKELGHYVNEFIDNTQTDDL